MRSLILSILVLGSASLAAHCQMPCGIYHDEIAYDVLDQYVETVHKGISELLTMKFETPAERNQYVRWIIQKEKLSDEAAQTILKYFLQQKIAPGEADTTAKVVAAHKMLSLLVAIKQTVDLKILYEFLDEWNKFKLMFHREGYRCKIEEMKLKKWQEEAKKLREKEAQEEKK